MKDATDWSPMTEIVIPADLRTFKITEILYKYKGEEKRREEKRREENKENAKLERIK